jgi:hypothetical protein
MRDELTMVIGSEPAAEPTEYPSLDATVAGATREAGAHFCIVRKATAGEIHRVTHMSFLRHHDQRWMRGCKDSVALR